MKTIQKFTINLTTLAFAVIFLNGLIPLFTEKIYAQDANEFLSKIVEKCENQKQKTQKPTISDVTGAQKNARSAIVLLSEEVRRLSYRGHDPFFGKTPFRSSARLQSIDRGHDPFSGKIPLKELQNLGRTLSEKTPDQEVVESVRETLHSSKVWYTNDLVCEALSALDYYRTLVQSAENEDYISQMERFYTELPQLVKQYEETADARTAIALAEAIRFMAESRQGMEICEQIVDRYSAPNVKFRVDSTVLAPLFETEVQEPVDVRENIFGTWVTGNGSFSGKTKLTLIDSKDSARIRVSVMSSTATQTVGANGPARVHSSNDITAVTTKEIVISPKLGVTTGDAKTEGSIDSNLQGVGFTRGGPIIRQIGMSQVQGRKPASEAESLRRAKRRINQRVDSKVDGEIAKVNERLKKWSDFLRTKQPDIDFDVLGVKTTNNELFMNAFVASEGFLGASKVSPVLTFQSDLYIQVHQSTLNNSMATFANRSITETNLLEQLRELFPAMMDSVQPTEGEADQNSALTVYFETVPADIAFDDDLITVTLNAESIKQGNTDHPGMKMVLRYRICTENGSVRLLPDDIQAYPLNFNPETDKMSAREQTIRTIVMKRLEKLTEKPVVLENIKLKEESNITLKPVHFTTKDGWLSIGYKLDDGKQEIGKSKREISRSKLEIGRKGRKSIF